MLFDCELMVLQTPKDTKQSTDPWAPAAAALLAAKAVTDPLPSELKIGSTALTCRGMSLEEQDQNHEDTMGFSINRGKPNKKLV